jgi:uncharacterized membrane protein
VQTDRGLDRIVNFSDAVVAIAITLIVLPLVEDARDLGPGTTTADYLSDHQPALLAAGLGFVVTAVFWRDHHRLWERATGYTPRLVNLNFLWLASIVALPVATVLEVSADSHDRLAKALYVGSMALALSCTRVQELELHRAGLLIDAELLTPRILACRWIVVGLTLLALIIAVAVPYIGLWALFLLFAQGPIEHLIKRSTVSEPA